MNYIILNNSHRNTLKKFKYFSKDLHLMQFIYTHLYYQLDRFCIRHDPQIFLSGFARKTIYINPKIAHCHGRTNTMQILGLFKD